MKIFFLDLLNYNLDRDFWQPAEPPEVMIVGPTRSGGPTIMIEGGSKGCQKSRSPEMNHVITIITTDYE